MRYSIRVTQEAQDDIDRLFDFWLERDVSVAEHAIQSIEQALALLQTFPFSCRKATLENPFLRELLIPFGAAGYLALFEIENGTSVTLLAVRHQREDDYH